MLSACQKTLQEDPGHWPWDTAQLLVPGPLRASGPQRRPHASWLGLPQEKNTLSSSQVQAPSGTLAPSLNLLKTAGLQRVDRSQKKVLLKGS